MIIRSIFSTGAISLVSWAGLAMIHWTWDSLVEISMGKRVRGWLPEIWMSLEASEGLFVAGTVSGLLVHLPP